MTWHKGESGNPGGRPRTSVRQALREIASKDIPGRGHTYAYGWALQLAKQAADGDLDAIKAVFDQIDGKPIQVTENTNKNFDMDQVARALRELPDNVRSFPVASNE